MKVKEANMQAFPFIEPEKDDNIKAYHSGMTMRDEFAKAAMQAVFTGAVMDGLTMNQDINCDKAAETAYTMADAMMKARTMMKARK